MKIKINVKEHSNQVCTTQWSEKCKMCFHSPPNRIINVNVNDVASCQFYLMASHIKGHMIRSLCSLILQMYIFPGGVLKIFPAYTTLSLFSSIKAAPYQPRVFTWLTSWQLFINLQFLLLLLIGNLTIFHTMNKVLQNNWLPSMRYMQQ